MSWKVYQSNLDNLDQLILSEQKAQEILDNAKTISQKASQQLEEFEKDEIKRISVLNQIQTQFEEALVQVNIITSNYPNSFVFNEAQILITNYEHNLKKIDDKIFQIRQQCPSGDGIGNLGICIE